MRWLTNCLFAAGVLFAGVLPAANLDRSPSVETVAYTSMSSIRLNSFEARLITLVNSARAAAGAGALTIKPGTQDLAREWAYAQVASDTMKHNPNLRAGLTSHGSPEWSFGAENVGVGPSNDPDLLFKAFMDSPGHKRNILDTRARYLGLGAVELNSKSMDGLVTYVTMNFVNQYSASYGAPRTAAPGLKRDAWRPDASHKITPMRDHDQRVDLSKSGGVVSGLVSSTHVLTGLASVLALSDGGTAGVGRLRYHDSLSLKPGQQLNVKLAAQSRSGKPVNATVYFRNVATGKTSIKSTVALNGHATTVTFTMPSGWTMPITEISVDVSRDSLVSLSPTQSQRYVRLMLLGVTAN